MSDRILIYEIDCTRYTHEILPPYLGLIDSTQSVDIVIEHVFPHSRALPAGTWYVLSYNRSRQCEGQLW